jgi:molybdopterin synthase catalytic subunit
VNGSGAEPLIPPVSGGSRDQPHVRVTQEPLSLQALGEIVADPRAGALVLFAGVTRQVQRLHYEAYSEMAEERIARIALECLGSHELCRIAIEHRIGSVPLGEPSVIVAVSAPHRAEAFLGAAEAIDRVKGEAPIWKREHEGEDEGRWVAGVDPTVRPSA